METYTISSTFFLAEIYPWCRQYTETSYTSASQTLPPPLFQPPHLQNFRQPNNAGNKEVEAAYSCCCSYFCINSCVEFQSLITIWWGSQQYLAPLHTRHDNRTSEHKRLTCTQFSKEGSDLAHGQRHAGNRSTLSTSRTRYLAYKMMSLLIWIYLVFEKILVANVTPSSANAERRLHKLLTIYILR
jgi:hypothetical protein